MKIKNLMDSSANQRSVSTKQVDRIKIKGKPNQDMKPKLKVIENVKSEEVNPQQNASLDWDDNHFEEF